jgi:hypothetical protein
VIDYFDGDAVKNVCNIARTEIATDEGGQNKIYGYIV